MYGTGGWAHGAVDSTLNASGVFTNWRTGWTAGAGIEYGFTGHWSAKLEWLRVNFSGYWWTNASNGFFGCTGLNCSTDARFNVIRAGLNYRL